MVHMKIYSDKSEKFQTIFFFSSNCTMPFLFTLFASLRSFFLLLLLCQTKSKPFFPHLSPVCSRPNLQPSFYALLQHLTIPHSHPGYHKRRKLKGRTCSKLSYHILGHLLLCFFFSYFFSGGLSSWPSCVFFFTGPSAHLSF